MTESKSNTILKRFTTKKFMQSLVLATAHLSNDIFTGILSPLIPVLINDFNLSKFDVGLLSAGLHWPSIIQPFFGRLADRTNIQRYIFLFPLLTSIFMSMIGVAGSLPVLFLFVILAGTSSACFHAITPPIAGKVSGNSSGKGLSLWMIGGEAGWMLSPILIIAFVEQFSLRHTPFLIIFGVMASAFLYVQLNKIDAVKNPTVVSQKSLKSSFAAIAPIMLPVIGVAISRAMANASTTSYLTTYLTENGVGLALAGATLSLKLVGNIAGTIIGGIFKDRVGGKPVLFVSLIGSTSFLFLFIFTTGIMQVVSLFLIGFFSGIYLPVTLSMVQEFSPENRSFANGIYLAVLFTINAIAGLVFGSYYDNYGGQQAFLLGAFVAIAGLFFLFFVPKGPSVEE